MMGWACLAMCFFYLAWRYNVLFVTDTRIDTRGLIYPRAMKQLFTGIYLSEICMIGLFGASVAPIQLALMVVFLIFTVLFHLSMNAALDPLLYNLPQSLLAEEESLRLDIEATSGRVEKNGNSMEKNRVDTIGPPKRANFLTKFLKPWIYADYPTLRALVPRHAEGLTAQSLYTPEINRDAYYPPGVTSMPPTLWIPEDQAGVSKQEVAHSSKYIPITDEGCVLDDKGKMQWERENTRPPVWQEQIMY